MKKIERDLVIMGASVNFLEQFGYKIEDYIPNYDKGKIEKFINKSIKNDENLTIILKEIANDCYKRLTKH